jgi:glycosyltransferase involved in cell wall biosynthesis
MKNANRTKGRSLFIVWKSYQRRAEVLAPLFDADIKFIPHLFHSKYLRPLDYLYKLIVTVMYMIRTRPSYAIVQAPPHYAALPPILLNVPFILDGHNGIFQSYWLKLPLFSFIMRKAIAIVVHNVEFLELFRGEYPEKPYFVVSDPLQYIEAPGVRRKEKQIMFICSFDQDEPIDAIIGTIENSPDYTFVITANARKLPAVQRQRLEALPNLNLTGFLSTKEYHETLCSSTAAIALTNMVATQQSGACEALSSNTPLIATRSSLSEKLFGEWAILVDNTADSISAGIRQLTPQTLQLEPQRNAWNAAVQHGVSEVKAEVLGRPVPHPEETH